MFGTYYLCEFINLAWFIGFLYFVCNVTNLLTSVDETYCGGLSFDVLG